MSGFHTSVLKTEVTTYLNVKNGKKYIDATLGGGGHGVEILEQGGIVLGIDQDEEAINYIKDRFKIEGLRFKLGNDLILATGNFREIDRIAKANGFESVSGILFDLGVSSYQLETAERGFSFQLEGPLDMRMSQDLSVKALDLVNGLTKGELDELFFKLGEENHSRVISDRIIRARRIKPISTTQELVRIVTEGKSHISKVHPATKVFQALRIAVNDELNSISEALPKALDLLESNGRIVVISFHSLEDRIVKNIFLEFEKNGFGRVLTKKPVEPSLEEIKNNRRSRSAKLRVFEKL